MERSTIKFSDCGFELREQDAGRQPPKLVGYPIVYNKRASVVIPCFLAGLWPKSKLYLAGLFARAVAVANMVSGFHTTDQRFDCWRKKFSAGAAKMVKELLMVELQLSPGAAALDLLEAHVLEGGEIVTIRDPRWNQGGKAIEHGTHCRRIIERFLGMPESTEPVEVVTKVSGRSEAAWSDDAQAVGAR